MTGINREEVVFLNFFLTFSTRCFPVLNTKIVVKIQFFTPDKSKIKKKDARFIRGLKNEVFRNAKKFPFKFIPIKYKTSSKKYKINLKNYDYIFMGKLRLCLMGYF